jgi:hypothetical protein
MQMAGPSYRQTKCACSGVILGIASLTSSRSGAEWNKLTIPTVPPRHTVDHIRSISNIILMIDRRFVLFSFPSFLWMDTASSRRRNIHLVVT